MNIFCDAIWSEWKSKTAQITARAEVAQFNYISKPIQAVYLAAFFSLGILMTVPAATLSGLAKSLCAMI